MIIGISGKMQSGKNTIASIIQWQLSLNRHIKYEEYKGSEYDDEDFCDWKFKNFAGKVKEIVSILTGIPIGDLEKQDVKNKVLGKEWTRFYWYHYKLINNTTDGRISPYFNTREEAMLYEFPKIGEVSVWGKNAEGIGIREETLTVRQLLQQVGTNLFRNQLHPDTWINALFADYKLLPDASIRVNEWIGRTDFTQKEAFEHMYPSGHIYPKWIITDVRFPNEAKAIKDRGGVVIRVNRDDYIFDNDGKRIIPSKSYTNISTIEHPSETALDNATFDYTIDNNGTIDELISKVKEILIKEKLI